MEEEEEDGEEGDRIRILSIEKMEERRRRR